MGRIERECGRRRTELEGDDERALSCCRQGVAQDNTRGHFYGKNEAGSVVVESALVDFTTLRSSSSSPR